MPIHEFISFKPTEAVLSDPTAALARASEFFRSVDGCSGLYFGASEEDKDVAFIVIVWEYYGNDQAVIDSPGYPGIAGLADAIASDSTILHVSFRDAPEPALAAPTTEVSVMTLKSGKTFADFDAALASIAPKVELEVGSVAWTWGETKEDAEKLVLFFGWESSKKHFEVVSQDKYKPLVVNLLETVDVKFHHASFKKFA